MVDKLQVTGVYPAENGGEVKAPKKQVLDKDAFLKILIVELTNQDPLDPMKDRDMIAQMAQLSQLEQITQFTHSVDKFFSGFQRLMDTYKAIQGASLVGKYVKVEGVPYMVKDETGTSLVSYKIDAPAQVKVKIYDESGKVVGEEDLGMQDAGMHVYTPSIELDDGKYAVSFEAVDENGDDVSVQTYGWDKVIEAYTEDGNLYLMLSDGKYKPVESVVAFK